MDSRKSLTLPNSPALTHRSGPSLPLLLRSSALAWHGPAPTRKPTQGSHWNNDNNYPLLATHTLVIHNGTIHNGDALFGSLALPRQGEMDSESIFRMLDTVDPSSRNGQYLNTIKVTLVVHL